MYQKDLVKSAWKSAGIYDENDSKLQQFLKMLDDPTQCWAELTDACRRSFAAYKAKLVQPIWNSNDKLVRLTVIRTAAPALEDEMALLEGYIAASDPVRDHVELKAIALKNVPRLSAALMRKPNLTQEIRSTLAAQSALSAAATSAGAPQTAPAPATAPATSTTLATPATEAASATTAAPNPAGVTAPEAPSSHQPAKTVEAVTP
jgi:hypothetical protein